MKIINSNSISAFGGLNFVLNEAKNLNINHLVNESLPTLPKQTVYNWFDIIMSYWSVFFCGGDCAEDLSFHLKKGLNNNPFLKVPSPDRVLERVKTLSTANSFVNSKRGKAINEFNTNTNLNKLNIKLLSNLSTFDKKDVVLDYDNTFIYSKKADTKLTYKKHLGYCPGVALVGNHIVYVENRNGNSAPHTLQENTFNNMNRLFKEEGITIKVIRADSASYMFETVLAMRKMAAEIFIRAKMSEALHDAINNITEWKEIKVNGRILYRGSTRYIPFKVAAQKSKQKDKLEEYRLVVTKEERDDKQINLFTGEAYNYSAILTNNFSMTDDQVVFFYNARGAAEREFDVLKNDFGWNHMPFSKLEQNTVFLIIMAMCRNFYNHIISKFSKKIEWLNENFRIKKFIYRFISIPAKWIRSGRENKLRIYGNLYFKT